MTELDLTQGDSDAAARILEEGKAAGGNRRGRPKGSTAKSTTARKTGSEAEDNSLRGDLRDMFNDFAEQFRERDPELAGVLERRKDAMSQGLVGLTRKIPPFRGPVKVLVAFFQPTLAFWELGSLLTGRYIERRQRRAYEHRAQQNGMTDETDVTGNSAAHGYAQA